MATNIARVVTCDVCGLQATFLGDSLNTPPIRDVKDGWYMSRFRDHSKMANWKHACPSCAPAVKAWEALMNQRGFARVQTSKQARDEAQAAWARGVEAEKAFDAANPPPLPPWSAWSLSKNA